MTWTLIYLLAGNLQMVPDLPSLDACVKAWQSVSDQSAHSPQCVQGWQDEARNT